MRRKLVAAFRLRRWRGFGLAWLVVLLVLACAYVFVFGRANRVFPELGISGSFPFGNTVHEHGFEGDDFRIEFAAAPAGSHVGGGVFRYNMPSQLGSIFKILQRFGPFFQPFPLADPQYVRIKIRGSKGGEKIEFKVHNRTGEGWFILGTESYPITSEFTQIEVPIREFTRPGHDSMGDPFDPRNGVSGFVFAVGDQLDRRDRTEVRIASVTVSDRSRHDWIACLLAFLSLGLLSAVVRLRHILNTHFSVFISYSSEDGSLADLLEAALTARGIFTLRDIRRLKPADVFPMRIARDICASRYFLLLATRHSIRSRFVGFETGVCVRKPAFRILGMEIAFRVGTFSPRDILVVDCEHKDENVPEVLRTLQRIRSSAPVPDSAHIDPRSIKEMADQIEAVIY